MENDQQHAKQTAESTEKTDGHPRVDSTTRWNPETSDDIMRHPIPNPASGETANNTQVTNESSVENRNSSSVTENGAINPSIQNQGTSNPSPSILLYTRSSESPLPFITLTPVAPESLEANSSTQYLHFFMTYNADGTVTALPIYPIEPTATAGDRSHNQSPGFQGTQALPHYAFKTQDSAALRHHLGAQSDAPEFRCNAPIDQDATRNASVFQTSTQSNVSAFPGNPSNMPTFHENQNNVPVCQDNSPASQNNVPAFQSNASAFQSNVPVLQNDVPVLQNDVPAFQSNIPAFQNNVPEFQSNVCSDQEVAQRNGSVFQSSTQSNMPVFLGSQSNDPAFQGNKSNAPPSPGCHSNFALNFQANESNLTYFNKNRSNTFQRGRNVQAFQNDQSNVPGFQNDQSNRSAFKLDGILPQGIANHARVESKLVEAVRAIALENPRFIGLFSNKNECRHRVNKQTPGKDFKKNVPISEIPLPPSPPPTTILNETNLPDTSVSTVEPQLNFSISEIPLPLGSPPAQSSSKPKCPEESSALAATPLNSAANFERNFLLSEIPLPPDTDGTKNSNETDISGVTSSAVIPQINPLEESFGANIPISEIPLPCYPLPTKFSNENKNELQKASVSVICQINTAEKFGAAFPISEIPLPLGPLPKDGANRNKLPEVVSYSSLSESSPNAQKCVTVQEETCSDYHQKQILNILEGPYEYEQISSEFSKKCTIDRDEFEYPNARDWEERIPQEDLVLGAVSNTESSPYKTSIESKFENRSSKNANKTSIRSTSLKVSSNQPETSPKISQQEFVKFVNLKKNSTRSESEVGAELQNFPQSSTETEKDVLHTNETETRTHPKSTSLEVVKDTQMGIREISTTVQKDSEKLINLREKIDSPKSTVERKMKKNDSKLFVAMSEKRTSVETEKEPKAVSVLPQVDVASGMDKIEIPNILQKEIGGSKWKLERKKKNTHLKLRTSTARESNYDLDTKITTITTDSNDKANKLDIPRIQTTKPGKPNETLALSRLQAPKGAKASDVKVKLIKPTTKRGLEQILFSNNCVAVSGKTTLLEPGMREESGPTKHVPAAVLRSLYRHRNSIQQFIGSSSSVAGHADDSVVICGRRAEDISKTEHKAKTGTVDAESASTTTKSSGHLPKKAKESQAEKAKETRDGLKKDFESDVTG